MTSAPSLAIKTISGIAVTMVWFIPVHFASIHVSPGKFSDGQSATVANSMSSYPPVTTTNKAEARSHTAPPISPKLTGISLHTRYFRPGTALIYTW
ncbi:MAG: hypothetical protein ACFB14_19020 [Leptolyngbyaceae cyanobacterium]